MSHKPMTDAELAELERVYANSQDYEMVNAELYEVFPRLLATIRQERERCESKYGLCE